ncbi:MAG: MCP four helix bundle domain-containing protein [Halobacteriovoraceae bacterium]|nr:MCP four helix bundle domain-containing protein [Halobacteriovoraceae bacterium]
MSVISKIAWTLGLICVFLCIVISGRTNIKNFEKVQSSIEEIYKDRLLVKGLIFDLSSQLHRKELAIVTKDKDFFINLNASVNSKINENIRAFQATKLTNYEEKTLKGFSNFVKLLQENEAKFGLTEDSNFTKANSRKVLGQIHRLQEDLKTLSSIQLHEGKQKLIKSENAVDSMNAFASFENFLLIFVGILMIIIVFVVPKPKEN